MQKETQSAQHTEIEQHLKTEEEYDNQNQRLTAALQNAEDKIMELQNQLRVGGENVVHMREMNARLQNDLDNQFTQHTQYKMVNEKVSVCSLSFIYMNLNFSVVWSVQCLRLEYLVCLLN